MPQPFRKALFLLIGAVAAASVAAEDHPTAPPTNSTPAKASADSDPLAAGREIFKTHCSVCHGPHGEGGKGPTLAQPDLPRARDEASLLKIVSQGIPGTEMPPSHLEPKELELVAHYVRSLSIRPRELIPGAPKRGDEIFHNKGGCMQCHMINGQGGVFGPDLSDVGRRRSADYIRRSIVDPNADVPQSYLPWGEEISLPSNFLYVRLVTRDGQEFSGVRLNEDAFSIQIRDATGAIHSFFKSELSELHKDFGKSPMPSYANTFSTNELNDLVAFLASLRSQK